MKIPLHIPKEVILQMVGVTLKEEPIFKQKVLIVDGEIYGKVEFPRSLLLGRGQTMKFPGYGMVQVLEATLDTLRCTKAIDEELAHEFERNPPPPDPAPGIQPIIPRDILRRLAESVGNAELARTIDVRVPSSCGARKREQAAAAVEPDLSGCGELDSPSSAPSRFL